MNLNSNSIGVDNEYSIYVPSNYINYKHAISITADYIDLIDSPNITTPLNYIRVYFDRPRFDC